MKYIVIIIIFCLSYAFAYGKMNKVKNDTIFAKGYILKEIAKKDVLRYRKYAKKRLKNKKNFDLPIDVSERYIYLPITKELPISTMLDSFNSSKLTSFYIFCPMQKSYIIFKEILGSEYGDFNCTMPTLTSSNLYKIKGYKNKLYEIYYIEGNWLRMRYNPKLDYIVSSFKVELINTNKEFIDLYYLLDYINFKDALEIVDKRVKKYNKP